MTADRTGEGARAARRLGLIAALLAAWGVYALGVPASFGTEALKAAFARVKPARPSSAKVSWEVEGAEAERPRRPEPAR